MTVDTHPKVGGVLLGDEIQHYATQHKLISPFRERNLKPAAYELTVGEKYFLNGKYRSISTGDFQEDIIVPPFEVVVLQTQETLNLPRFMIARWNIRVKLAYEGLLWVGAAQVDPGWVGQLCCPIYNLSNKNVYLRKDQPFAVMDFIKTTPFRNEAEDNCNRSPKYGRPPKRVIMEDYRLGEFRSALYAEAGKKLKTIENDLAGVRTRTENSTGITFTALGILIAALSVLVTSRSEQNLSQAWPITISLGLSISVFFFACLTLLKPRLLESSTRRMTIALFFVIFAVALMGGGYAAITSYSSTGAQQNIPALRSRVKELEQRLNKVSDKMRVNQTQRK